jgi:hypothetical protein
MITQEDGVIRNRNGYGTGIGNEQLTFDRRAMER